MKRLNYNSALLLICIGLLSVCAYGIYSRPTIEEIDQKIMMWGQHYGAHFSEVDRKAVTPEAADEPKQTE